MADLYGSTERSSLRKKHELRVADEIRTLMPDMIREHVPALAIVPVPVAEYEAQSQDFLKFLREYSPDLKRVRLAHQFFSSYIDQGNRDQKWALKVPPRLMSVPRSRVTRNRTFFQKGASSAAVYKDWNSSLATRVAPKKSSFDELLADVLISAIVHGALAQPSAVVAMANLLSEARPLQTYGNLVWMDLVWEPVLEPENFSVTDESGEKHWKSLRRFYPDTYTLGLILSLCKTDWPAERSFDERSVWSLIRTRLGAVTDRKHFREFKNLSSFCEGALSVTEMLDGVDLPQALLECAKGSLANSSLRPEHHLSWLRNNASHLQRKSELKYLELQRPAIKRSNKSSRRQIRAPDALVRKIRHALRLKDKGQKRSAPSVSIELASLTCEAESQAMALLIDWLCDSLTRLKVSSVHRYFIEVKDVWLYFMADQNLDELDESDWEALYEQMLEQRSDPKAREYLNGRLAQLHAFVSRQLEAPALSQFFNEAVSSSRRQRVRTGVIPEKVFQQILSRLSDIQDLDDLTCEGMKLLLILAFRTGLRRGELLKLRLSDVEDSQQLFLFIRNNRYGDNKSTSALRKLECEALLLPAEFDSFGNYIGRRRAQFRAQPNTLLFSLPSSETTPLDARSVSELVKQLLLEQGLIGLTFHHLRHSALTNLMLVLDESEDRLTKLSPYSAEQAKTIRKAIFSSNPESQRDRYWALAGVAGHLTPETTFSNYLHCVDRALFERLNKFDPQVSLTAARSISGLPTQTLNRLSVASECQIKAEGALYSLSSLRQEILQRLNNDSVKHKQVVSGSRSDKFVGPVKRTVSIQECYAALRDLDAGESIATVATRYGLEEEGVEQWLGHALDLQNLKTAQANARLFHRDRKRGHYGLPLLPVKPNDRAVSAEVDKYVSGLMALYKDMRTNLLWSLNYWLNHTHSSGAGLRFIQPSDLERFLAPMNEVIPPKRWRLVIHSSLNEVDEELGRWSQLVPNYEVVKEAIVVSTFAQLYLSHPEERAILDTRNRDYKAYSSPALRYVLHMLAIMIGYSYKG